MKRLITKISSFNLKNSPIKYLILFKRFTKWKRNTFKKKDNVQDLKSIQTESSINRYKIEELKECTFHPKINQSSSTRNFKNKKTIESDDDSSVYIRLYSNFKKYNLKKEAKKKEKDEIEKKEISFSPKLNKSFKSKSISISNKNFGERLQYYKDKRNKNIEKLEETIKKNEQEKYTFQPHLNKNRGRSKIKEEVKKKEEEEKPKLRKNLDIKRLERLYSSYKNKKSKIRKIQEEMDKEEGITFKPYINTENSFYQKEFSEKKSEILNNYKSDRNPNHVKSQKSLDLQNNFNPFNQPKKRVYSSKEKEIITQNIINRLYGEGLQQHLLRNNIQPMQYSKGYYE